MSHYMHTDHFHVWVVWPIIPHIPTDAVWFSKYVVAGEHEEKQNIGIRG